MKIYEYTDHRSFVREKIAESKKSPSPLTHGHVAEAAGMKSSFLSQVLGGQQEFSNDQLFAIGRCLELEDEELDYLLLLNEYHRSGLESRKAELLTVIEAIQHRHLRVIEYLSFDRIDVHRSPIDEVLCDPLATMLESYFTVESNLKNPQALKTRLGVSEPEFEAATRKLVNAQIIAPKGDQFYRVEGEIFVYKINAAAKFNAVYSRLKAVEKIFKNDPTDLISTFIFVANDGFIQRIKAELLAFQSYAIEKFSKESPTEVVFINIDLFPAE